MTITKASSKEKVQADKMIRNLVPKKNKCVPLSCTISCQISCLALVTCDPMSCGGLTCKPLKSV